MRMLVYGMGVAGAAVARAASARGIDVIVTDDHWDDARRRDAGALGVAIEATPSPDRLNELVASVDVVIPSPGVPEHHRLTEVALAAGVPLRTEIDLAYEWEQERPAGPRPMLAITGTDGKTTVTTLTAAIIDASGRRAVACGNTDIPLVTALDFDVDVFVVECASFRLRWLTKFRPDVGTWLNLAPDHLDWHRSFDAYAAAKARIWDYQRTRDIAVANAEDDLVMAWARRSPGRIVTFGAGGDYFERNGWLHGPSGPMLAVEELWRHLPHDRTNALAAAATALEAGAADVESVRSALGAFHGISHRITFVAAEDGIAFYDDSKATTPHAALCAIRGFDHVVLLAGGRNKDLDLSPLAAEPTRMRGVVAIGEAAPEIVRVFREVCPVVVATTMHDAVAASRRFARPGDTVLLSPACTSFDWYGGYAERGDDFARAVRRSLQEDVMA